MARWTSSLIVSVMVALAIALSSAPLAAQSPDDEEARSLYDAGRRAFDAGRYDRALEHFRHAYELSARPALLYNIGQAADRLRHDQEALDAFERYLATGEPEPTMRTQIEGRIEVLRAEIASDAARPPDPVTPVEPTTAEAIAPPTTTSEAGGDATPGVALLVAGGVLAAGGAVCLGVGASENDAVQGAQPGADWRQYEGRLDAANALVISGGVAAGVGVVAVAVGAILVATTPSSSTRVAFGPGALTICGQF